MRQRQTTSWAGRGAARGTRLRVLIESADPVLAVSDFGAFANAGIDVALCHGPVDHPTECPAVRGESCALAAGADVVLFDLVASGADVLEATRQLRGAAPVVLRTVPPGFDPEGLEVLPAAASVTGQIDVLRRAALDGRRSEDRSS